MNEAPHVLIVEGRFYDDIMDALLDGAVAELDKVGATYERLTVPGAFEVPNAIRMAVRSLDFFAARKRFDGYIALGCVIRGETTHYDYICAESARKLQDIACEYSLAVGYGILTCETVEQAWERAKPDRKDKGGDAARACLAMIDVKRHFRLYPR